MSDNDKAVRDLIAKGDGVLAKRGTVWTYPGCLNGASGTNLVLPVDYVSDQAVQAALSSGTLSAVVMSPASFVSAVRLASDDAMVVTAGLAGSAEMGTELPLNSRVEIDAGAGAITAAEAEKQVVDGLKAVTSKLAEPPAEIPDGKSDQVRAKK